MSKNWVGKLKPKFWEVCHAGVQFQWKKNHLQTAIKWEYLDFSCHSTKPTQEAWMPHFCLADFTFPSIAAALYIFPKLVNLSRNGFVHVTFKWHNHMQLAQWEKLRVIVKQKKSGPCCQQTDLLNKRYKEKEKIFSRLGQNQGLLYKYNSKSDRNPLRVKQ